MKCLFFIFLLIFCADIARGAGESEAGGTSRGSYLAEQGIIIPPDDIIIDSYIAQIDFSYSKEDLTADIFSKNHSNEQRSFLAHPLEHSGLPRDSNISLHLGSDASIHRDILCQKQNRAYPSI